MVCWLYFDLLYSYCYFFKILERYCVIENSLIENIMKWFILVLRMVKVRYLL